MGGGVRDLLLGREPKDFDIATNARPEQVRQLFRNCRLVGRRFRLAHVRFGEEVIEVATFRAAHDGEDVEGEGVVEDGRILRDNVYGTLEDDVWRRDFTVNALYYNVRDFSVVDFTDGMSDLKAGVLRCIGDPEARYREDPVRMLRAVRLAAKLGFRIEPASELPLFELGALLRGMPPARLFDETLKLFLGGIAVQTFELLRHYGLFGQLFPQTETSLSREVDGFPLTLLVQALANTDGRVAEGKPVTPAFLFGALLWEPMRRLAVEHEASGMDAVHALQVAGDSVVARLNERVSLPRRFSLPMREIWQLQPRLAVRRGTRSLRLLEHPRFRAAYDFLMLRREAGEPVGELCEWWTQLQAADEQQRPALVRQGGARLGRRRRPRRRKPAAE